MSQLSWAFEPVIEEVSGGHIDWSTLRLEATISSQHTTGAWQDRRLQEQDAHDRLSKLIESLASQIEITPGTSVRSVINSGTPMGDRLEDGLKRWGVEETRYHHTGGVALDGSLDLRSWLWPSLVEQATAEPAAIEGEVTGLLIDARGHTLPLALAPVLQTATGRELVNIAALSEETARMKTPVVYVRDPADPAAAGRAGDAPLFATLEMVKDGHMILDSASAGRLTSEPQLPALVAAGRVVVVVDP